MIDKQKIIVVMPAYNAEKTLEKTVGELPDIVDDILVVDDSSSDNTEKVAKRLKVKYFQHAGNMGYGANQKTCYTTALKMGGDIIIMVHPDYQYSPKLVTAMAAMITSGHYDMILASRILGKQLSSREGGMPLWRWISNRFLTFVENILISNKLSEYHTGYRAYSAKLLKKIPYKTNSNDFVFDNQVIAQAHYFGFRIGEISCPTRYFGEASSINFSRSIKYGFGCIYTGFEFLLNKWKLVNTRNFKGEFKDSKII
jgi:glycosyltransferase involved in cell wall biosynthesis